MVKKFLISSALFMLFFWMAGQCFADASTETVTAVAPDSAALVAHYEFEGSAKDSTGTNHGTLNGNPTYAAGVFGQAISLDGDGDYVNCGNESSFNLTNQITVAAWIKVNEFDNKYQTIISKGDNSWRLARVADANNVEFACNGTAATRWTGKGEVPWAVLGTTSVNDGKWHHIAGVFDGTRLQLYIDGVLQAAKAAAKSIDISESDVCIGANAQAPGREWNGLIDDVCIYNYALSQPEILAIMGKGQINLSEPAPATLYRTVKRYDGLKKYEEAQDLCQLILKQYADSPSAKNAQIYLSRRDIISLIESKKYADAETELDSLIADFNDQPELAEALYLIAQAYSPPRKFKEAESVYKQLMELFPDSPYGQKAQFNWPKLRIFSLLKSEKYAKAEPVIEKFITDFVDDPRMPGVLYWFAKEIEAAKNYQRAKDMYNEVILLYPDNSYGLKAELKASQMDILSLIRLGNDSAAQTALDYLIADFNDHPDLPEVVFRIGEEYYYRAFEDPDKCVKVISEEYFKKPKDIWERIVAQWPGSESIGLKHAYYFSAVCYGRLGEYENALAYYQKVVDSWPDYEFAWSAQYLIGSCYERLRESAVIPESEANVRMEEAYKAVVEKYPKSPLAANACLKLGRINLKRQQKLEAAMYFELFLARARPADPRIKSIKATLENLKGEEK